jgi:hypothetical protein
VRLHGIQLGAPVDVLLDAEACAWSASTFAAATRCTASCRSPRPKLTAEEIGVRSAFLLLDDAELAYYARRAGRCAGCAGRGCDSPGPLGLLRDLELSETAPSAGCCSTRTAPSVGSVAEGLQLGGLGARGLTNRRSETVASLVPVDRTLTAESPPPGLGHRARHALRTPANWIQLAKFCTVARPATDQPRVYKLLLDAAGLHYVWRRPDPSSSRRRTTTCGTARWTFRQERGHVAYQGLRFFVVSALAYGTNLALACGPRRGRRAREARGAGDRGRARRARELRRNKLWSFRRELTPG